MSDKNWEQMREQERRRAEAHYANALREAEAEIATLLSKIERQDAALERLSERAEAAESAVDVLEKQATGVTEDAARHRSIAASVWDYLRSRDALPPREGSEHDRIMIGLGTIERRLTAQLAAERERYEVALNEAITDERHTAGERAGLRMAAALFRALPASEG